MYLKTLLLAATVVTCWAYPNVLEKYKGPISLHRLDRSLMNVSGGTLDENASPKVPCNYERLHSHASDCTKFYKCIDVFSNNDYRWLAYKCHVGTIFSPEYQSCISGNCSKRLISATSAVIASVVAALAKSSSAASTAGDDYDEVVVTSFGHQLIDSSSTPRTYGIPQCKSLGRLAHQDDCGQYYECVPNENGGFAAREKSCLGHAFHRTLLTCVPLQMVKGCIPRSTRMLTSNLQGICNNAENEFKCADCKTLIMCVEGNPYIEPCEKNSICSNTSSSFTGGVCHHTGPVGCNCNEANSYRRDVYDPYKFILCDTVESDPIVYSCPEGLQFNEQCGICTKESESKCEKASEPFVTNDDCTGYFTFVNSIEGWVKMEVKCKNKTMFNEETGRCEDPCNWYSGKFTCKEEGRFVNPANCTNYYECIKDPSNPTKFIKYEEECPTDYEWSETDHHCVTLKTKKEECVPTITPANCVVQNGSCSAAVCSPSCTNGECIGPNICNCTTGWTGNLCENPVCSPNCTNGECIGPNICNCTTGWTGNLCDGIVCSEALGFFKSPGSNQCMKVFSDKMRDWTAADAKCKDEGLALARPHNALALRPYLNEHYGDKVYYLDARGTGSSVEWQHGGQQLSSSSPLWEPGNPGTWVTTGHCLQLVTLASEIKSFPSQPYKMYPCDHARYTLCEPVPME